MNGVKAERPLVHATEDGATDVKHVFEEPKNHNFSVDGFLSMDKNNDGKFYGIEDFRNEVEHDLRTSSGGLHSYITQEGEDELNLGVLDGILDEIDEVEGDDAAKSLAAACEDYLLDFTQEISALNHHPCGKMRFGNSSSDSHSPGCSGSSNGAVVMSESSAGTDPDHNGHDGICLKTSGCGMNMASRNKTENVQHSENSDHLNSSKFRKPNDLRNVATRIVIRSSGRNNSVEASIDDLDLVQKRQRKPTRRYIEESVETKSSRHIHAEEKLTTVVSKGQRPRGRPPTGLATMRSGMLTSLPAEEPSGGVSIRASSHIYARRGQSKKRENYMEDELEESSYADESEDEIMKKRSKKGSDRRKHQRMWTLPEVTKLVDGISEFGVGRWTQIKRLSFAASAYRTPIDLRDKWRNLLRASSALKLNKGATEQKEKNSGRPLPKSLLHRVRELASLHPYPRKDTSRSSSLSMGKKGAGGRNVRRRSST